MENFKIISQSVDQNKSLVAVTDTNSNGNTGLYFGEFCVYGNFLSSHVRQ